MENRVNYEEKMLTLLVEQYRRSRKDSGANVISRRTQIEPSRLYRNYQKNDGDMDEIEAVNEAARLCREKGFVTFDSNGFSNEIAKIYLADDKVEEIERYLSQTYQVESKHAKRRYIEGMLETYGGRSPAADAECERLRQALARNRIPKDYLQTEEVLKALVFIENNQKPLYLREASMLIYGSSKYLEENTLDSVCRLLRASRNQPCQDDELPDEILEAYHITKEKQKLSMKGGITVWIDGTALHLGLFAEGIEFFPDALPQIQRVQVHAPALITVENRTSYLRAGGKETAWFYLGGYMNRYQRDFLKLVYRDNPSLQYLHFGDIDAGGFYIYRHLCRMTGIPFSLYRMSVKELENPRFQSCLQPLTENDRRRLESLSGDAQLQAVTEYMLQHNVKLEQEAISCI